MELPHFINIQIWERYFIIPISHMTDKPDILSNLPWGSPGSASELRLPELKRLILIQNLTTATYNASHWIFASTSSKMQVCILIGEFSIWLTSFQEERKNTLFQTLEPINAHKIWALEF